MILLKQTRPPFIFTCLSFLPSRLLSENIEPLKHSFSHSTSHLPLILKTSADNNNDEQPQPLHLISPEISAELGSGGALDSYIGGNSLLHSRHGSIVSVSYSENNPTPNISRRNSSSSHVEDMHTDHIDQIIADEQNSFDHTNPELSLKRRNQKQQLMEMSMLVSNIEPGSVSELMDKNSNTFKQPQPLQRLSTISVSTPSLATAVSTPASRLNNQRIGALKQEGFMRIRTDSNPTTSTPTSSLMKTGTPASGLMVFGNTVIPKFKSDSNLRESMLAVSGGLQASDYSELIGKQAMPTPFVQGELMSAVDEGTNINLNSLLSISAILKLRAQLTEKNVAFTMLDSKGKVHSSMTFGKLHSKAAKVAQNLRQKALLQPGTPVGLVYRRTELLDFVVAVFGCFYAGVAAGIY